MAKVQISCNEFVAVKDIRGKFLERKDGILMGYLRVHTINLDLLSDAERAQKTSMLTSLFQDEREPFAYMALPREIDLDGYKRFLKECHRSEMNSAGKKRVLAEMHYEAVDLATMGENFEHQHYIKIWETISHDRHRTEIELKNRLEAFVDRYFQSGIHVDILEEKEILKLCNLFGNTIMAPHVRIPDSKDYEYIPQI